MLREWPGKRLELNEGISFKDVFSREIYKLKRILHFLPDYRIGLFSLQSKDLIIFEDIQGFQTRQDYKQTHLAPKDES